MGKPLGSLRVRGNVVAQAGQTRSLVEGAQRWLKARALPIEDGGDIDEVEVTEQGRIKTLSLGSIEVLGRHAKVAEISGQLPSIGDVPTRRA